jgi:hypothetical protein
MICGHDYYYTFPDVIENVKRLEDLYNTKATIYGGGGSLWSINVNTTPKKDTKFPVVSTKYTKTRALR